MKEYKNIAIVNLLEDWNAKDYGFALYESELKILHDGDLVVVNTRGKNNRVLGTVKKIMTTEEYGKGVSAQVVGVVNMEAYNKRIAEEERLKEIAKQKQVIEKELKSEIEKINNIALYEKMAKEHPENPRLTELVNALKELGE